MSSSPIALPSDSIDFLVCTLVMFLVSSKMFDYFFTKIIDLPSLPRFPHLSSFTCCHHFPRRCSCPGEPSASLVAVTRTQNHANTRSNRKNSSARDEFVNFAGCAGGDFQCSAKPQRCLSRSLDGVSSDQSIPPQQASVRGFL